MALDLSILYDPAVLSLLLFAICFAISALTSSRRLKIGHTARAIRSEYRRSWIEWALNQQDAKPAVDVFRNNIMVSSSILSGLVIAFGLLANAALQAQSAGFSLFMLFMISLMTNALFRILMQVRALTYFPILMGASSKIFEKNEKVSKEEYIGKLLDHAYDDFSDVIRSLFYIIALLIFIFDTMLFIAVTIVLTYLFVRRDLSEKSRIEIF